MILYHVTDVENLDSIARYGLVPAIGRLSEKLGENVPKTYFFRSSEDVVTACMNWLGEEYDEIDAEDGYSHNHVVLECRISDDVYIDDTFYEIALEQVVTPKDIRISKNPDLFVDFEYGDDFVAGFPMLANWG